MPDNIYTIGYESTDISNFIVALKEFNIKTVIDVRALPISRKKGFSKTALSNYLHSAGIEYVHLKGLGNPKAGRNAAKAKRWDEFLCIYLDKLREKDAIDDMDRARNITLTSASCLLCFEREAKHCHRKIVASKVAELTHQSVMHLCPK